MPRLAPIGKADPEWRLRALAAEWTMVRQRPTDMPSTRGSILADVDPLRWRAQAATVPLMALMALASALGAAPPVWAAVAPPLGSAWLGAAT